MIVKSLNIGTACTFLFTHCKYNDSEIFSFNTRTDLTVRLNILCTFTITYFIKYLLCQFRFTQGPRPFYFIIYLLR